MFSLEVLYLISVINEFSIYAFIFKVVFFLSLSSSVLHSILIMVQASTLNVAFNSHNKSLLTIMMSNNVSAHTHTSQYLHRYVSLNHIILKQK